MPFCSILLYLLPDKRHLRVAEISSILHQNHFIICGVFGVLMSYEIARRIKLVVWRVSRGSGGVLRDLGGSMLIKWVQFDPYRALFASLEVLYGTRCGFKNHIMVQMFNDFRGGTTDTFLDLWGPPGGLQNTII